MIKLEDRYYEVNIRRYLESDDEYVLRDFIDSFSCPKNPDIEHFLKHNAIDFTKKQQSVTYLVLSKEIPGLLMGYFALTVKPLKIGVKDIPSNTWRRKIERVARFNEETQTYSAAGYLIAQLGKNFTFGINNMITGSELLTVALNVIRKTQYRIGGMIAFLDAENSNSLTDFYTHNGFHLISDKASPREEMLQFYRMI